MGRNLLQALPAPKKFKTVEEASEYINQLYVVLAKWKMVLSSTGFLGAEGNLTLSTSAPTSTDGEHGDVWVKY